MDADTREAEGRAIIADMDGSIRKIAKAIGMEPIYLESRIDSISPSVSAAMPRSGVDALQRGERPSNGFGLVGGAGTGKSMAVAAYTLAYIRARIEKSALIMGHALFLAKPPILWLDWPIAVAWMRENRDDAWGCIERHVGVLLLVIDDIGAERRVGESYESDYAADKLDLLIHGRSLRNAPTIWTSNLHHKDISERYGARTVSRLVGLNPPLKWIEGADLRFSKKS